MIKAYDVSEREDGLIGSLAGLWDWSVRTSHHFLSNDDICRLRPFVVTALRGGQSLRMAEGDGGGQLGFIGVCDGKIEMLFVSASHLGRGVGSALMRHAISELRATEIDVNEQNETAAAIYAHWGFRVIGRDETDGQGNAFQILHMKMG